MNLMVEIECENCPNRDCSLLKFCSSAWLGFISEKKIVIRFKAGQQMVYERTPANQVYFILSGKAKIYKTGYKGKQQILRLAKEGEIVGYRGYSRKSFPISISAMEDTVACGVSMKDFGELLVANPNLTREMLRIFAEELCDAEDRERVLGQLSVREKVADALLRIKSKFNPLGTSNGLGVKMSRQEIGDVAGTTKEQVSKYLADFKEEGSIELKGKIIQICNEELLSRTAGYFPENYF